MSNTLTIEQVGDSLTRAINQVESAGVPFAVVHEGRTLAHLVPSDRFNADDETITPEEAKQIAIGLKLGEIDIAEGRVITLDEAVERLRRVVEARGEQL